MSVSILVSDICVRKTIVTILIAFPGILYGLPHSYPSREAIDAIGEKTKYKTTWHGLGSWYVTESEFVNLI